MTIQYNGMRVLKAYFMETGTTPDMPARNFTASLQEGSLRQLLEQTNDGSNINALSLSSVAGDIILPDMNRNRNVAIPNTFASTRLRFLMILGNPSHPTSESNRMILSGYTDSPAFALNTVDFAPEMRLYFNNAISVSQMMAPGNGTMQRHITVNECNHILHPMTLGPAIVPAVAAVGEAIINNRPDQAPAYLRPSDVLNVAQLKDRAFDGVFDGRPLPTLQFSNRSNAVPAHYLNKTLHAMANGKHQLETSTSQYPGENLMSYAAAAAAENSISRNFFLDNLTTNYTYGINGYITWAELCRANPELTMSGTVDLFTSKTMSRQRRDVYISNRGDFDSLANNSSIHSQIISQVLQSVAALVLKNLIVECSMSITNDTPTGAVSIAIHDATPLLELPPGYLPSKIPGLCHELEQIVFRNMGTSNYGLFGMRLRLNTLGETFVEMTYNGIEFKTSVPSYCDAMHSHLVSHDYTPLAGIGDVVSYIGYDVLGLNDTESFDHSGITPSWSQNRQFGGVAEQQPVVQPMTTSLPPQSNNNGNGFF